jgi:hypothetical protein
VTKDCSDPTAFIGVQVKEIDRGGRIDRAGTAIHGAGTESGSIHVDVNQESEEGR